jgi:hypothetical protein
MATDRCYLRRVRESNPLQEELARQAVDAIERTTAPGTTARFYALAEAADEVGVPIAYVLDELERRVRERS